MLGPRRPLIVLHHSDVQRQKAASLLYRPLARRVARRAGAVVVATRSHLEQAEDLGPAGVRKARVIPFGVDLNRFAPRSHPPRPVGFPPKERGPVGLFVGRLVSYKGLDVLLRAVAGSQLHVVIAGDGPLRPWLREEIARSNLDQQVWLAGVPTDREIPSYYQAADYFVLPSTTPAEMFGVVLVEAMACATPVINTALPTGVREVSEPDVTGLMVQPGDADALRAAMTRLASDADLRSRMGEAGRKRAEQEFSLEKMLDEHLRLCGELVEGQKE